MGSAAVYQLAKRGVNVLGIDRLTPPHTLGSTHGDTRITRQAIGEGAHYTPLSLRSYEIFREIEKKSNKSLLQVTGGLIIAAQSHEISSMHVSDFFDNTLAAARRYNIRHDLLDATEIRSRFPQFHVTDDERGYYEYDAGILRPELAVAVQLELARECGADLHTDETVLEWNDTGYGVTVKTNEGSYKAEHLVLSVGPWLPGILPEYAGVFKVYRQALYWFDISRKFTDFVPGKFPIFIWQVKDGDHGIYGFPAVDGANGGIKIATEEYAATVTPESVERQVSQAEIESIFDSKVARHFPAVGRDCVKSAVCLYTVTADSEFVIDRLPNSTRVVLCSPCSGHGFKHSAAIGECVAEMVTAGHSRLDISPFRLTKHG